jgi:hypothetical protein
MGTSAISLLWTLWLMWMQGSISVSMSLHQTSFCFVNSHLTSGHNKGDELKRNSDVTEILRRTKFPRLVKLLGLGLPETILAHEWAIDKCFHFISVHFFDNVDDIYHCLATCWVQVSCTHQIHHERIIGSEMIYMSLHSFEESSFAISCGWLWKWLIAVE